MNAAPPPTTLSAGPIESVQDAAPRPETPVSTSAPTAVPTAGTWRPARRVHGASRPHPGRAGPGAALELRPGGAGVGQLLASIHLATTTLAMSSLIDFESVESPILASLRERLQNSEATKRYRELREQHRLAAQRQSI